MLLLRLRVWEQTCWGRVMGFEDVVGASEACMNRGWKAASCFYLIAGYNFKPSCYAYPR